MSQSKALSPHLLISRCVCSYVSLFSLFLRLPFLPLSLSPSLPLSLSLLQQFNVFWFGDLNYRVNKSREETVKLVAANNLGSLHAADQLALEMEAGRVFHGCVINHFQWMYTIGTVGTVGTIGNEFRQLVSVVLE